MPQVHLPLDLPAELSDEALAQLVECLYEIARSLESCYLGQLRRYYEARCEQSWPEVDPRQRSLWPEHELEF